MINNGGTYMKKIISFLTAFVLATSMILPFGVSAAVSNDDSLISFVSSLDIMKGDPDGNFRLDDYVTRAEFTKVAIAASVHWPSQLLSRISISWGSVSILVS